MWKTVSRLQNAVHHGRYAAASPCYSVQLADLAGNGDGSAMTGSRCCLKQVAQHRRPMVVVMDDGMIGCRW